MRAHAAETVRALRGLGIRHLVLLTGDNEAAARAVGASVGIDEVEHGLLPEDKLERAPSRWWETG